MTDIKTLSMIFLKYLIQQIIPQEQGWDRSRGVQELESHGKRSGGSDRCTELTEHSLQS